MPSRLNGTLVFIYNTFALYNCTQFSKNYGKIFLIKTKRPMI